jgi:hypothetical protein
VLLEAVAEVLEFAEGPMRVRDVHAVIERRFAERVPFSSVDEALSTHCSGSGARFRRVGYGLYVRA